MIIESKREIARAIASCKVKDKASAKRQAEAHRKIEMRNEEKMISDYFDYLK